VGTTDTLAADVDGELLEVSQDGKGQLGRPCIAAQLVGRVRVALDVDGWLLGLQEELASTAYAKAVVRGLGRSAHLHSGFVDHTLVGFGVALLVMDVPPQRFEKGVNELQAHLGLVVVPGAVGLPVALEPLDQIKDCLSSGHCV